ncbi:MAG: metal-dependent hydrolase [Pseudomonadota bacterium]|nr:metal-dependent hydrolase [Pseudomonadota bacterium]
MDNVTHALIGVLLARAALPWVGSLRGALWAALLASEAPDIDLVLSPFFEDTRLGYLVHHRGHTHTLVGAALLALVCAAFARWRAPEARTVPLLGLALGAALLHVGADAWNNYGVHPFWPFENAWHYGDMIFILEPLLWLALLPLAFTTSLRRGARLGVGALGLALASVTAIGLGPLSGVAWALGAMGLVGLQARWDRLWVPAGVTAAVLLSFGAASRVADAGLRARFTTQRPGELLLDVVLTPRPATPWCWQGFVLSRDTTTYHARSVLFSLAPGLTPPRDCAVLPVAARTAPMVPPDLSSDAATAWGDRFEAPSGELAALAGEQCRVDAFLRFARAPFWEDDGERIIVGDLRFDFEQGLSFAEILTTRTLPADTHGCDHLPPWRSVPVRALLEAGRGGARRRPER